ncbi:nicotinic receptor-associated protein 1 [Folsomia candida]|uniref:nicotinic receptor-associated protein 1 n=1 Tax=Folsomia candida TaxID=158441 RepID=UPI000B8F42F6|nr:nicotinic receptor-associated protein 1 [Folsomia candida]
MLRYFILVVSCVTLASAQSEVTISLSATELLNYDGFSGCDTVITIFCSSTASPWTQCGAVEMIPDNMNPVFPERFTFPYAIGTGQQWRFELVDRDVQFDDPIGTVIISVDEYMQTITTGGTMTRRADINRHGYLHVKRES